jgi:hypothetical protein
MQECFDKDMSVFNKTSQQHVLRRHQDIFRDYSAEFRRTHENIKSQLQRFSFILILKDDRFKINF